jgi:hypothetical protein
VDRHCSRAERAGLADDGADVEPFTEMRATSVSDLHLRHAICFDRRGNLLTPARSLPK